MIKICPICKEPFEATGRQLCCSEECHRKYRTEYNNILKSYNSPDMWDDKSLYYIDENTYKDVPAQSEINSTIRILKDFGVSCNDVPCFNSHKELNDWKHEMINQALA